MDDMDALDNLMDNFDIKTFWKKRELKEIVAVYTIYVAVGTVLLVKAVLDSSNAGAVPKGMDWTEGATTHVVR